MHAAPNTPALKLPRALGLSRLKVTALVASALIATVLIGLFVGIYGGSMSWAHALAAIPKFLRIPKWDQWLGLACWSVLAGALFTLGAGGRTELLRTRLLAVASGIVMPVGLVFFGHTLGRYSQHTTGPFDSPLLSLSLALYGLLSPWLLGRAALILSRSRPSRAGAA